VSREGKSGPYDIVNKLLAAETRIAALEGELADEKLMQADLREIEKRYTTQMRRAEAAEAEVQLLRSDSRNYWKLEASKWKDEAERLRSCGRNENETVENHAEPV